MEVLRLVFFLCLVTTARSDNRNELGDLKEFVKIMSTDNEKCTKIVRILGYPEDISIFFTHFDSPKEIWHDFYTAISCKFAQWTINKIFHFLKHTPLFYQKNYEKLSVYKKAFGHLFKELMTLFVEFDTHVERFIQTLHEFSNQYSNVTYYNDFTIVNALVSLRYKMFFMKSYYNNKIQFNRYKSLYTPDTRIVQLIVEEMNEIQRFLSLNCSVVAQLSNTNHPQFTGYWITEIDRNADNINISSLLSVVTEPLHLKSDRLQCSVPQMLFTNFLSLKNLISHDIKNAQLKFLQIDSFSTFFSFSNPDDEQTKISISNILKHAEEFLDTELLLRYQDCVLTTIMKLVLNKTEKMLLDKETNLSLVYNLIENLNSSINNSIKEFPELFVNGFKILNEMLNKTEVQSELDDYRQLLDSIDINDDRSNSTKEELSGSKNAVNELMKSIQDQASSSSSNYSVPEIQLSELPDEEYVRILLGSLLDNIDEFKCFHQSTKFRIIEQNKYYKTLIENKNVQYLEHPVGDNSTSINERCNFVFNVYLICYEAVVYVNESFEIGPYQTEKNILSKRIWDAIHKVRDYFFAVIKMDVKDFNLLKLVYKIAIILNNFKEKLNKESQNYHVERIFSVVMIELNIFETKFCDHSNFNFLLINNVNWINFGNGILIEEFNKSYLKQFVSDYDTNWLSNNAEIETDFQHIDIEYLLVTFITKSKVVKQYKGKINFFWKGTKLDILQIYNNAMNLTLNYEDLFGLYHIFFKLHVGAVYFEIKNILNKKSIKTGIKKLNELKKYRPNFQLDLFPENLRGLIKDIDSLWDTLSDSQFTKKRENIEEKFTKFSMEFNNTNTVKEKIKKNMDKIINGPTKAFISINDALMKDVRMFYNLFSTLKIN